MYKICVNKKMPTTCEECGLIEIYNDDFSPISESICKITGRIIGMGSDYKEILPEWCPIEGSIPKCLYKQSEEEKRMIEMENQIELWRIYLEEKERTNYGNIY